MRDMDACKTSCDHVETTFPKHNEQKIFDESPVWVTSPSALGSQPAKPAKVSVPPNEGALIAEISEDLGRHPRLATKAATATKRLQAAAANRGADQACHITCNNSLEERRLHANPEAVTIAPQPRAHGAVGFCPARTCRATAVQSVTTRRARLPGLRTSNGLCPAAENHGLLIFRSAPGQDQPQVFAASTFLSSAALRARVIMSSDANRRPALTAGAFLPFPGEPPVEGLLMPLVVSRQQLAECAVPVVQSGTANSQGAKGAYKDGPCREEVAVRKSMAASVTATEVPAHDGGRRRRNIGGQSCGKRMDAGDKQQLVVPVSQNTSGASRIGCSCWDDSDEGDEDDDVSSSYDSCRSISNYKNGRSYSSEMETEEKAIDGVDSRKRCRIKGTFQANVAAAAVPTSPRAGAFHSTDATAGKEAMAAAGAVATSSDMKRCEQPEGSMVAAVPGDAGSGGVGNSGTVVDDAIPRIRNSVHSYGPPWPLIPRSGRAGTFRCSLRAAQSLWPTLLEAARTEPQIAVLDVDVPKDIGKGEVGSGRGGGGSGDGGLQAVATVAVSAILRCDDKNVLLRPVEEWPFARFESAPLLLQISPSPGGRERALVQVANRHVWAYYHARGGKLCCPPCRVGVGAEAAQTGAGAGIGDDDSYVLQMRLGLTLFDNRSFDLGIRAAERLFGHLVPGVQERIRAGTGSAGSGGDGVSAVVVGISAAEGHEGVREETANSSGGGGLVAGDGGRRGGTAAAKVYDCASGAARASKKLKCGDDRIRNGSGGCGSGSGSDAFIAGGSDSPSEAAVVRGPSVHLPIGSLIITVIAEAWPEARSQVEFRYRFPRLLGMPNNARHAYATLGANLVSPMVLYGAQPGDMLEMWRRPGGAPDEFVCRVVPSTASEGRKRSAVRGDRVCRLVQGNRMSRTLPVAGAVGMGAAVDTRISPEDVGGSWSSDTRQTAVVSGA